MTTPEELLSVKPEGWADRHPKTSAGLAALTTGVFTADLARDLVERPTAMKAIATGALGLLTVAGAVEAVRPGTFRLWERMETRFKSN